MPYSHVLAPLFRFLFQGFPNHFYCRYNFHDNISKYSNMYVFCLYANYFIVQAVAMVTRLVGVARLRLMSVTAMMTTVVLFVNSSIQESVVN